MNDYFQSMSRLHRQHVTPFRVEAVQVSAAVADKQVTRNISGKDPRFEVKEEDIIARIEAAYAQIEQMPYHEIRCCPLTRDALILYMQSNGITFKEPPAKAMTHYQGCPIRLSSMVPRGVVSVWQDNKLRNVSAMEPRYNDAATNFARAMLVLGLAHPDFVKEQEQDQ